MKTRPLLIAIRLSLAALAVAGATSLNAQSATGTISGVLNGSVYDYTITLNNTGPALESFWYGWTSTGNNLPSIPSSPGNSLGWASAVSGNSIKYTGNAGDALAGGTSATFTFQSTSTPDQMTLGNAGMSVVYTGGIDFSQGVPGDSSGAFAITAAPVPEPSTFGLMALGLAACWRKLRSK